MAFSEELAAVYGGRIITEEPMYKHTSLGLGGKAEYYLAPQDGAGGGRTSDACGKVRAARHGGGAGIQPSRGR